MIVGLVLGCIGSVLAVVCVLTLDFSLLQWLGIQPVRKKVSFSPRDFTRFMTEAFDLFILLDESYSIVKMSKSTEDLLGFTTETLQDQRLDRLLEKRTYKELEEKSRAEGTIEFSGLVSRSANPPLPVEFKLYRQEQESGPTFHYLAGRDLTDEIELGDSLLKQEEQFRQLAQNLDAVFWMRDVDGNALYVSPQYEQIWERSLDAFDQDVNAYTEAIVDEDYERVREAIPEMKEGEYDIEYRIQTPDGTRKWIHDRAFPIRNNEGEVYRIGGIAEDITKQRDTQRRLEKSLEEKEMLLQEIHHRVKNNMQVISSLLNLQFSHFEDPDVQENLEDTLNRIQSMAITHEMLYQSDDFDALELLDYLEQLTQHLLSTHGSEAPAVNLSLDVDDVKISLEQAISCGLIVTELVTNSLQHGFAEGESGTVEIKFHRGTREQSTSELIVRDDGSGLPDDLDNRTSETLGLKLVDTLVSSNLDGTYEITGKKGTDVRIRFQLDSVGR